MAGLKQLIHEVHRRSLWQVLGIYVVGSWIALQVVDVLGQNFGLPAWFPPFALALLVIGLPIVLATAFVQEGVGTKGDTSSPVSSAPAEATTGGSAEAPAGEAPTHHRLLTWRNAITGGMAAFALWGILATGWMFLGPGGDDSTPAVGASVTGRSARASDVEDRRSIAVLPFSNSSAEVEGDAAFFASGIHDDILTQLSKIDALKVISRTSVMQYDGTQKTIGEIGDELGVATVLEGSVQRAGDRVRVNVQLIDADTDEHLWAETYDEELTAANIFAIQSDVAQEIAGALQTTLAPDLDRRLAARPTESLEAYDLYLRGRYLFDRGTRESREEAVHVFAQAIDADPEFALAYAWLSGTYVSLSARGYLSIEEALPPAREAAQKALEIDGDLPEGHVSLGAVFEAEGRWEEAEREYLRAIQLNPGNAFAHERYGLLIIDHGRTEAAREQLEIAAELDPTSRVIRANLAFARFLLRDFDGTANEALRMIEFEPDFGYGHYILAAAFSFQGLNEEAIEAATRAVELDPEDLYFAAGLAFVNARAGNTEVALEQVAAVEERGGSLKEIALIYSQLGDLDRAFSYLEQAYDADPGDLQFLAADPSSDPLREDPRFDEFLQKVGMQ